MRTSILIADTYPIVRRGLRALLEAEPDWHLVGETGNGREAVMLTSQLRPDIVILDVNMPELNGLDAAHLIVKTVPETRILIFTSHHTQAMIEKALDAGVRGYVLKSDPDGDLVVAVRTLMQGRTYYTSMASDVLVDRLRGEGEPTPLPSLTPREIEIVQLLAAGKSNKEVAEILTISSRTVENHRAQIMLKLGLKSFSELIRYAIRNGMIEP